MASSKTNKQKLRAFSTLLGWLCKSKKTSGEQMDDCKKKGGIRLRVVLTRKEAAQLLAMYVHGKEEMVAKIVGELERPKPRRTGSSCGAWRPMLESIPED